MNIKNMNKWETINNLYISKGLKIFPVKENEKTPRISLWNIDCSGDLYQVLYYYENNKEGNWGLPCKENNLFVLDLDRHDDKKNGIKNFEKLCSDLNIEVPNTLIQETPSLGKHYIFKSDDDLKQVNGTANAFNNYPGIDIRNSNYIVVEPSQINGKLYKFINTIDPQPMPQELKQYILENVGTKEERKKSQYTKPKEVYKGDRDNQLFQYINNLYYKTRLDYDEILLLANNFNDSFDEPLSKKTVEYKVRKAFEKDRGECLYVWVGEKQ